MVILTAGLDIAGPLKTSRSQGFSILAKFGRLPLVAISLRCCGLFRTGKECRVGLK